jgi:hypothetical protein
MNSTNWPTSCGAMKNHMLQGSYAIPPQQSGPIPGGVSTLTTVAEWKFLFLKRNSVKSVMA